MNDRPSHPAQRPGAPLPPGAPARFPRHRTLGAALLAMLLALAPRPPVASAGEGPSAAVEREKSLAVERRRAIERGCAWIARKQNLDGSFGDNKALVAFTALSTLALMSEGSGVGRGTYGEPVRRGVTWLVKLLEAYTPKDRNPRGYFHAPQDLNSKMHGQGYATLALASALGSADQELGARIRDQLSWAVKCAAESQTALGGWGYEPSQTSEHEGSVTVTVAQGLRAARDAGVKVPVEVINQGLRYLRKSQKLYDRGSQNASEDGSFKYSWNQDQSTYALTAAAISCFYLFGEYGSSTLDAGDRVTSKDRIDRGIHFMRRRLRFVVRTFEPFYYYGHFYAAWAAWQKDGSDSVPLRDQSWGADVNSSDIESTKQFWGPWHAKMYPELLGHQLQDGSWTDPKDRFAFGDLLPTTFAVLTLAIPDEMIPVFQR